MIILFKNNKAKREEIMNMRNFKNVLLKAIIGCMRIGLVMHTVCEVYLSDFFVIIHMWPIFTLFLAQFFFNLRIRGYQILASVINLFAVSLILLPLLEIKSTMGLLSSLAVTVLTSFSDVLSKQMPRTNNDLKILFIGVYSAGSGCFLMIIKSQQIEEIHFGQWLVLLLIAAFSYYSMLFQTKAVESIELISIVCPFSVIPILFAYIFDCLFFGKTVYGNEIVGLIILLLTAYFFTLRVVKNLKRKKFYAEDEEESEREREYVINNN